MDNIVISSQENILLESLKKYYNKNNKARNIIDIINGTSNVSIRMIDFLITNYSKKNNISYKINNTNFNIYSNYKSQLKSFNKKYFDPFSRGSRIPFFFLFNDNDEDCIITTIGQLNFFRWYLEKNIHEYIINNIIILEQALISNKKNKTKMKKKTTKTKVNNNVPIIINNKEKKLENITVSFD
jgi:hypothetical protein